MNTTNFPRLGPAYGLAALALALALALGMISCGNPAQGRAHTVNVQIGQAAAAQRGVVSNDGAVASVTVEITDSDSNPVGSISLTKNAGSWSGSIELTGSGIYAFAATASSTGGGKIYTGSASQNIPTDGLSISIPVSAYTYAIGETGPAGGLVFYDSGSYTGTPACRYMEAAPSDQSAGIQWYNGSNTTTGASGTAAGTGVANTAAIVASQGAGSYAAQVCADLVLGGYDDWFLPSKDELDLMYTNLALQSRGGFAAFFYWTSSEYNDAFIWDQGFDYNNKFLDNKNYNFYVRAARSF